MLIPAHINRQCDDLSRLVGDRCLPYLFAPSDRSLLDQLAAIYQAAFQGEAEAAIDLVPQAAQAAAVQLRQVDAGRSVFAMPLQHEGDQQWLAIGRIWGSDDASTKRLLMAAAEAAKRGYELESHRGTLETAERQARQSVRELAWVRELASYAQDRGRTSISAMANRVLRQLHRMVNAEALAVVPAEAGDGDEVWLSAAIYSAVQWKLEDAQQLLPMIKPAVAGDYSVQNNCNYQLPNGTCTASIAVQIGSGTPIGHLVAINRRIDRSTSLRRVSDLNFTAAEASMLQEAASFFEAEGAHRLVVADGEQLIIGMLRSMSSAIEARDPYTRGHSERVARLSYKLARHVDLPVEKCREIYVAGVLHDIGKIGIPDHVLLKPGRLEEHELAIIQKHPTIGHHILSNVKRLEFALPGILYHHERWDGGGYPHGLSGDEIPLMARIMAVVDSFDAMTSSRPYRSAMLVDRARSILEAGAGEQWDKEICESFLTWLDRRELSDNPEDPTGVLAETMNFGTPSLVQFT